jgi:Glycine cleavage H-protein
MIHFAMVPHFTVIFCLWKIKLFCELKYFAVFNQQQVNASPYEKGWIIKVKLNNEGELNSLMDSDKYNKFCEEEDAKH